MKLKDLEGEYDAVFSLGHLCLAAIQLQKNNLRPFSGVLDWMGTHSLPDVSRLLKNRFDGFMELPNLRISGYATNEKLLVADEKYNLFSNHDFDADKNTLTHLATYPEVKEKFNRRVGRFLDKMETAGRILFVRTEGAFGEVLELESVLSAMVKHDFALLVVNHSDVSGIVEKNWPLAKVCAVGLPNQEIWNGNNEHWSTMLQGIHLKLS